MLLLEKGSLKFVLSVYPMTLYHLLELSDVNVNDNEV